MEHCSRFWGDGEGCFGVVWVEDSGDCWIRNSNTSTAGLKKEALNHAALVDVDEMAGYTTKCPAEDASVHELSGVDGLGYTVNCNKAISGYDACFSGMTNKPCLDSPFKGFFHTETLEECVRICVDQHPLCKGVTWSPDLKIGFANCWPKTGFPESGLASPGAKQGVLHSATITRLDPVNRDCPTSKTYTTDSKKKFDIHCGQDSSGTNMTAIHAQNVTSCMDTCAKSDQKCIGIVYDSSLTGGFKNCYLKNTTNTLSDLSTAMYASLSTDSGSGTNNNNNNNNNNGGSNSSSSTSSSSSSKAWIAGPVIGGLAALGLLAFAIFWWRRRKAKKAGLVAIEKDGHEFGQYGAAPAYSPGGHQGAAGYYDAPQHHVQEPMELSGQGHGVNELPASTKYAHQKGVAPQELP
jgi:hypothetical protein